MFDNKVIRLVEFYHSNFTDDRPNFEAFYSRQVQVYGAETTSVPQDLFEIVGLNRVLINSTRLTRLVVLVYAELGKENGMLMVVATETAVWLGSYLFRIDS